MPKTQRKMSGCQRKLIKLGVQYYANMPDCFSIIRLGPNMFLSYTPLKANKQFQYKWLLSATESLRVEDRK